MTNLYEYCAIVLIKLNEIPITNDYLKGKNANKYL